MFYMNSRSPRIFGLGFPFPFFRFHQHHTQFGIKCVYAAAAKLRTHFTRVHNGEWEGDGASEPSERNNYVRSAQTITIEQWEYMNRRIYCRVTYAHYPGARFARSGFHVGG